MSIKSRFGFHNISYEVFRELKTLHKLYWQAIYQRARVNRWQRKSKKNRTKEEPVLTELQHLLLESNVRAEYSYGRMPRETEDILPKRYMNDETIHQLYGLSLCENK